MAKSLGQIHTVSHEFDHLSTSLASGSKFLIDLPGQLTLQLQHMIRMMQSFKLVGIDMSFGPTVGGSNLATSMSGQIQYYQPTKGRVEACKMAYNSVRRMMKLSGVKPENAINYDFRPPIQDPDEIWVRNGADFFNQASVEDNGLATCLANGPGSANIFGLWNQGVQPRHTLGINQWNPEEGFDIGLRTNTASADWTLNEGVYLQATTTPTASEELEYIPFELSYTAADAASGIATSSDLEWRPDPALYLSILTGQLIVHIEESSAVDETGEPAMDSTQLDISVHVAGWKSILSDGKKNHRRSKKGGKSRGRKRRSKK